MYTSKRDRFQSRTPICDNTVLILKRPAARESSDFDRETSDDATLSIAPCNGSADAGALNIMSACESPRLSDIMIGYTTGPNKTITNQNTFAQTFGPIKRRVSQSYCARLGNMGCDSSWKSVTETGRAEAAGRSGLHTSITRLSLRPKKARTAEPAPDPLECVSLIPHPDTNDRCHCRGGKSRASYQPDSLCWRHCR